jgi:type II secretory pathway pseudopilin PulG
MKLLGRQTISVRNRTKGQGSRVEGREPVNAGVQPIPHPSTLDPRPFQSAFTIIEIALCLGIIGFALVAIIAVLPRGLDVQKKNREETIIGGDAEVWMSTLRGGARGYDDLTNYVLCITNLWTTYNADYSVKKSGADYYTPTSSQVTSISPAPDPYWLTNGLRIVGLLGMPKLIGADGQSLPMYAFPPYQSNYVIAYVRAFSGAEVADAPQTNATILADAFIYRMIVENFPYSPVDTNGFCLDCLAQGTTATNGMTADQQTAWWAGRTNLNRTISLLQANTHDFRLRFRWPVLPNGEIPNYGLLTFRSLADGALLQTNDNIEPNQPLYFVQSATYITNDVASSP